MSTSEDRRRSLDTMLAQGRVTCYFHAGCFDGAVSAACLGMFLRAHRPEVLIDLRPVNYSVRANWRNMHLPFGSAIVDFLFHPDAGAWWDHHSDPFVAAEHRNRFETEPKPLWIWDQTSASCAAVIAASLTADFGFTAERLSEAVHWADIFDGAKFASPSEIFQPESPAGRINLSLAEGEDDYNKRLANLLMKTDLASVAKNPEVDARYNRNIASQNESLSALKKSLRIRNEVGEFSAELSAMSAARFGPFMLYPALVYAAGIVKTPTGYQVLCMRNPWRGPTNKDLGRFFDRLGGGGHPGIGAIDFPPTEEKKARETLNSVLGWLKE